MVLRHFVLIKYRVFMDENSIDRNTLNYWAKNWRGCILGSNFLNNFEFSWKFLKLMASNRLNFHKYFKYFFFLGKSFIFLLLVFPFFFLVGEIFSQWKFTFDLWRKWNKYSIFLIRYNTKKNIRKFTFYRFFFSVHSLLNRKKKK